MKNGVDSFSCNWHLNILNGKGYPSPPIQHIFKPKYRSEILFQRNLSLVIDWNVLASFFSLVIFIGIDGPCVMYLLGLQRGSVSVECVFDVGGNGGKLHWTRTWLISINSWSFHRFSLTVPFPPLLTELSEWLLRVHAIRKKKKWISIILVSILS